MVLWGGRHGYRWMCGVTIRQAEEEEDESPFGCVQADFCSPAVPVAEADAWRRAPPLPRQRLEYVDAEKEASQTASSS